MNRSIEGGIVATLEKPGQITVGEDTGEQDRAIGLQAQAVDRGIGVGIESRIHGAVARHTRHVVAGNNGTGIRLERGKRATQKDRSIGLNHHDVDGPVGQGIEIIQRPIGIDPGHVVSLRGKGGAVGLKAHKLTAGDHFAVALNRKRGDRATRRGVVGRVQGGVSIQPREIGP